MRYRIYSRGKEVSDQQTLTLLQDEAAGVFESMRAYHGKISHEAEHLARLFESAKTVGYHPMPDRAVLQRELAAALRASGEKNTSVRLTLCGGKIFVIIGAREPAAAFYKTGVVLKTASFPRGGNHAFPYQAKASSYQQAVLASTEPNPGKAFDWLFLDRGNYLTETRVANFFIIRYRSTHPVCGIPHTRCVKRVKKSEATLLTPPAHLILNGVTRRLVIKCALELGLRVEETLLTRHDFFNADEAFLSNTSWEILPVRELDGRAIGDTVPGPVTLELHRLFNRGSATMRRRI